MGPRMELPFPPLLYKTAAIYVILWHRIIQIQMWTHCTDPSTAAPAVLVQFQGDWKPALLSCYG